MAAVPKPRLTHVGVFTQDIDAMVEFYTNVLGLTVTDRGDIRDGTARIAFLSSDPGEHHQFVMVEDPASDSPTGVAQQISFLVGSLDELRVMHERLVEAEAEIRNFTTHGNAWSIYFSDPDNNRVEVYTHTPWHIPQPHAVPFDLSLSNEEIIAQTEAHCREDPGFMPMDEREKLMAEVMERSD